MRRKVAVFANGWSDNYLQEMAGGMGRYAQKADVDLFLFVNFSGYGLAELENKREFNILTLPNLEDFDGVLLLTSTYNFTEEVEYLHRKVLESGVPSISVEYELDGIDLIGTDNYSGIYELVSHLIEKHGARRLLYIGGIENHKENLIRREAFLRAAGDRGIPVDAGDLINGEWSEMGAYNSLDTWIAGSGRLPDAIVCANDTMALGVCQWLKKHGYSVPDDVMVTGYDCVRKGQMTRPILTSVDRDWQMLGFHSLQLLLQKIKGFEIEHKTILTNRPAYRQSCGCLLDEVVLRELIENLKQESSSYLELLDVDSHFRHIHKNLRKVETSDQISMALSDFLQKDHSLEGDRVMIFLHPDFFSVENENNGMLEEGFPEEMDIVCSLFNGLPKVHRKGLCRKAIFHTARESEKPGIYILVSLHGDHKNYGFAMLSQNKTIFSDRMLYIWTRHMNQTLEQVRSNVKIRELTHRLSDLSMKDGLTGTYNRLGCEKVLYPYLRECQERGGQGIVMIVDIDCMKKINDSFGHTSGDQAITLLAEALRSSLPEDFYIARYGGDEFFVAGEMKEGMTGAELSDGVMQRLDELAASYQVPYTLKASLGAVVLERGEPFDLVEAVQRADDRMYVYKKEHHQVFF